MKWAVMFVVLALHGSTAAQESVVATVDGREQAEQFVRIALAEFPCGDSSSIFTHAFAEHGVPKDILIDNTGRGWELLWYRPYGVLRLLVLNESNDPEYSICRSQYIQDTSYSYESVNSEVD